MYFTAIAHPLLGPFNMRYKPRSLHYMAASSLSPATFQSMTSQMALT